MMYSKPIVDYGDLKAIANEVKKTLTKCIGSRKIPCTY